MALVIVPTALAFGGRLADWFEGKPAPASIRQDFVGFNADMQKSLGAIATPLAPMATLVLMQRLAVMFATERAELENRWAGGDQVSTEDLRQGLRRYRSFFERLLAA